MTVCCLVDIMVELRRYHIYSLGKLHDGCLFRAHSLNSLALEESAGAYLLSQHLKKLLKLLL